MRQQIKNIHYKLNWKTLYKERKKWNSEMIGDLRSNHAGETGAVYIYKGALSASKIANKYIHPHFVSNQAINFSREHLQTEKIHLDLFDRLLEKNHKSKFLSLWKISGFSLGFLPSLCFGDNGLFVTIDAVETFVEKHYVDQIQRNHSFPETLKLLRNCCHDEILHKEEAQVYFKKSKGVKNKRIIMLWKKIIEKGSSFAVFVCKKI